MEVTQDMGFSLPDRRISACQYKGSGIGEVVGSLPLVMFTCRLYGQLKEEEEGLSSIGSGVLVCFGLETEALTYTVVFFLGK